jgi:hypothetical protein
LKAPYAWRAVDALDREALPSVMAKIVRLALAESETATPAKRISRSRSRRG